MIPKKEVPTPTPSIGKSAPLNRLENFSSVNSDAKTVVLTLYFTEVPGTQVKYSVQLPRAPAYMVIAEGGHFECVHYALNRGSDVNAT